MINLKKTSPESARNYWHSRRGGDRQDHEQQSCIPGDAGYVLTDAFTLGLSLVALLIKKRPTDYRATYVYQRIGLIAAFINSPAMMTPADDIVSPSCGFFSFSILSWIIAIGLFYCSINRKRISVCLAK